VAPAQVVLVAIAVFASAAVQSTTGFGFALLAVPLMAVVIPAEEAVVLCGAFSLLTSSTQAITERAHAVRPVAARMLVGALIGAPFGLAVLSVTTGRQLRFVLAGVIFTFLLLTMRGFTLHRAGRAVDLGAGVVAGVLNTSLSTNGPPIVMALHAREMPPDPFRGTIAAVFTGSNVISVTLFAATGRYDVESLVLFAVSFPALCLEYVVGTRLRRRFDPSSFRRLVVQLLALTGVITLVGAIVA
jgi:uncharacterized membrane protein YfcA